MCVCVCVCGRVHRDARSIGGLTKVVTYPTYTICCKRLWSMPAPNAGFKQHTVVNYLANLQTEVILTKGTQDNLGHMQLNK